MVEELAARHSLPKEVIEGVTQRTGGVPLFVEELTRLPLEDGGHARVKNIPPTLRQSLTARRDRLGSAREVVRIGAVIGRDFSYALLPTVAGMEDAPLQLALDRLAEADILLVQGLPAQLGLPFQAGTHTGSLREFAQEVLHRRIGEALHDYFAQSGSAEPELLAHHFTQAGLTESAIEW